jgi:hypothetical protein
MYIFKIVSFLNFLQIVLLIVPINCRNYGGTLLVAQLVEALRYKPEGRGFDS